jgi:hypothetical protein
LRVAGLAASGLATSGLAALEHLQRTMVELMGHRFGSFDFYFIFDCYRWVEQRFWSSSTGEHLFLMYLDWDTKRGISSLRVAGSDEVMTASLDGFSILPTLQLIFREDP